MKKSKKIAVQSDFWELLEKKISRAMEILNKNYKTDSGRDTTDYFKGYLTGLIELKANLELHQEEESEIESTLS